MRSIVLVVMVLGAASSASSGDLSSDLATLKAVGHEGSGNEAAQQAWNDIVANDATDLSALLTALDDANPLAANWIRAAIDAIAERRLKQGKLSAQALDEFVRSTDQPPRARRLAFEWLERVDPQAPARLIPGFANDPSLELRREAVARLLARGEELSGDAKDDAARKAEAIDVTRQAFASSRDLDQIEDAAKALKALGETVDLPRHYGFITSWKLIGPFDNRGGIGFKPEYPPEREINFVASYPGKNGPEKNGTVKWIDHTTEDAHGMVNLNNALGKDMGCVAYAANEFYSPEARDVELRIGCICACKLWLNGKLLAEHEMYHSGNKIDQYVAQGKLNAGRNVILIKVCQNEQTEKWAQDWEFQLRVCDRIGTAVLSEKH
ncbi:MAG TPA: hypothetical protein VHZ24_19120 [Pirellulales bacterium]|nr:hypothetical protein [Pirellulales bacterium]